MSTSGNVLIFMTTKEMIYKIIFSQLQKSIVIYVEKRAGL